MYEVLSAIGSGMGDVYKARDPKLGRDVALRILPPGFSQNPERIGRFEREAQLLAARVQSVQRAAPDRQADALTHRM